MRQLEDDCNFMIPVRVEAELLGRGGFRTPPIHITSTAAEF